MATPAATPNNEQEELPEESSILNTTGHSVGSTDAGMRPRSRSGGRYLFKAIFCFVLKEKREFVFFNVILIFGQFVERNLKAESKGSSVAPDSAQTVESIHQRLPRPPMNEALHLQCSLLLHPLSKMKAKNQQRVSTITNCLRTASSRTSLQQVQSHLIQFYLFCSKNRLTMLL